MPSPLGTQFHQNQGSSVHTMCATLTSSTSPPLLERCVFRHYSRVIEVTFALIPSPLLTFVSVDSALPRLLESQCLTLSAWQHLTIPSRPRRDKTVRTRLRTRHRYVLPSRTTFAIDVCCIHALLAMRLYLHTHPRSTTTLLDPRYIVEPLVNEKVASGLEETRVSSNANRRLGL
jgi:hypothetical protein